MAAEVPNLRPDVLITVRNIFLYFIKINLNIIKEATYGVHVHEPREQRENRFTRLVHDIITRGGRCLIPVFALGRAQELLLILGIIDFYIVSNNHLFFYR